MLKEVFEKVPANARINIIDGMITKHKSNPIILKEFGGNVFYDKETHAIVGICIRKQVFDESQLQTKKVNENLRAKLFSIKGLGEKATEEILEEYNSEKDILKAIEDNSFSVGGIGKEKISELKKVLKKKS